LQTIIKKQTRTRYVTTIDNTLDFLSSDMSKPPSQPSAISTSKKTHDSLSLEINEFTHQIATKPTAKLFLRRGQFLLRAKKFTQALSDFRQALKLQPDLTSAWYECARLYLSAGRIDQAKLCINTYLDNPNLPAHGTAKGLELLADIQAQQHLPLAASTYWQAVNLVRKANASLINKLLKATQTLNASYHEFARQVAISVYKNCARTGYSKYELFILLGKFGLHQVAQKFAENICQINQKRQAISGETATDKEEQILMSVFYISAKQPEVALQIIMKIEQGISGRHSALIIPIKAQAMKALRF
jgi:tetratricopeptide (TPR) repeat protein